MTDYTYSTGNPIGSTDVRDGVDNLKSFDVLLNSLADTYQDRLGHTVPTAAGAIKALGPVVTAWTFTTGGTLNYPNEAALNPTDGNYYGWTGAFPKVVAAGSTPATSGGIGAGAWVVRTDVTLRSELSSPKGPLSHDLSGLRDFVSVFQFMTEAQITDVSSRAGSIDVTAAINAALSSSQFITVYFPPGVYKISGRIIIHGNTSIFGAGKGTTLIRYSGDGSYSGPLIVDQGNIDGTTVCKNISLVGFELDCNDYQNGGVEGIIFKKTGNVTMKGLHVHHCGGTAIRWSFDQDNAGRIRISDCVVEYCHQGDGMQGVGDDIVISDCSAFSCGDTCFATIWDWHAVSGLKPSNIVISNCKAKGEWVNKTFTGAGKNSQLGFGFGPYGTDVNMYATLSGCTCENLYSNAWFPVFSKLTIEGCTFKPHSNQDGTGVRIDGVENVIVNSNRFECDYTGNTYYGALGIQFGQFTYGASTFNASCKNIVIDGNSFQGNTVPGIIIYGNPSYGSFADSVISNNSFIGFNAPIKMLPLTGAGSDIFKNLLISNNTCDSTATQFIQTAGIASQYSDVRIAVNNTGVVPVVSGSGVDGLTVDHRYQKDIESFPDNVVTTVLTLDRRDIEVHALVQAGSESYTAIARYASYGTTAREVYNSSGANVILSLSGINVQCRQLGTGSAQTLKLKVRYMQ